MLPVSFYEKYKYSAVFWGVFVYLIQNSFFIIGAFWFGNIKKTEDRVENESKKKKKKNITEHLKLSCKPSHEPNDRQAQHPCLGPYCPLVEVKIKIADDFTAVAPRGHILSIWESYSKGCHKIISMKVVSFHDT